MSPRATRVLVVEDEPPMRRFLRATLASHGYEVLEAETARECTALVVQHAPDLILLDLGLPDQDGLDVTRELRAWCPTPLIVISARGQESDKVAALDAGADDYLTKPFGVGELLARLRVAMRHAARSAHAPSTLVHVGPVVIDDARHEVRVRDELVHLTPIEYRLLACLAHNAGRVLTHRQILQAVWGPNAGSHRQYLRVYMTHLRRKIERDPARPQLLLNEPGVGYRMRDLDPE